MREAPMRFIRYSTWLIFCFCAFALGIFIAHSVVPPIAFLVSCFFVFLIFFFIVWHLRTIRFLFLILAFFAGGMIRLSAVPEFPLVPSGVASIRGIIDDFPRNFDTERGYRIRVEPVRTKLFATTSRASGFDFGDFVEVRCDFKKNDSKSPFYRNLRNQGVGYVCQRATVTLLKKGAHALYGNIAELRKSIQAHSGALFPEPEQSLLMGVLIGDRDGFSHEFQAQMRAVGVSHITVISGQNILIVATFVFYALFYLRFRRTWASIIVIALLIVFSIFVGSDASVIRATIMYAAVMLAYFLERPRLSYYILAATAFGMLMYNPRSLFDVGFILSFAAVFGLMHFTPFWKRHISAKLPGYIRDTLVATLAAQTGVLPFLMWMFGSVSLIAPITNVLILLVVPYAMGMGLMILLLSYAPLPFLDILSYAAFLPLTYIVTVIEWFSRLPYITLVIAGWLGKAIMLIFVLGVYGSIWQWKQIRGWYESRFRKKPVEAEYEEAVVKLDSLDETPKSPSSRTCLPRSEP